MVREALNSWWHRICKNQKAQFTCILLDGFAKPKQFSTPLAIAKATLAILFLMTAWTLISFLVLPSQQSDQRFLSRLDSESEAGLMDYLFQYEDLEKKAAFPTDTGGIPLARHSESQDDTRHSERSEESQRSFGQSPLDDARPAIQADERPKIVVKHVKLIAKESDKLNFQFEIHNRNRQKAKGYFWAIAHVKSNDGSDLYLASPTRLTHSNGKPDTASSGETFSIKKFRKVNLNFQLPEGATGEFQSVNFGLTDRKGTTLYEDTAKAFTNAKAVDSDKGEKIGQPG